MEPEATFNSLVGDLDYPMLIVTARAGDERSGCLIGFATQTSVDPSRFLVCLSRKNRTYRVGVRASRREPTPRSRREPGRIAAWGDLTARPGPGD